MLLKNRVYKMKKIILSLFLILTLFSSVYSEGDKSLIDKSSLNLINREWFVYALSVDGIKWQQFPNGLPHIYASSVKKAIARFYTPEPTMFTIKSCTQRYNPGSKRTEVVVHLKELVGEYWIFSLDNPYKKFAIFYTVEQKTHKIMSILLLGPENAFEK